MRYPTRFQQKTLWNAATGVSILVLGALILGLIWLVGYVFGFLQPVLVPLIVAGIVAYVLEPVITFLEKRGMTRLWSVITLFSGILLAVTLLVAAVLPGVQRGHDSLLQWMSSPSKNPANVSTAGAAKTEDGNHLTPALVRSLQDLRIRHKTGPVGWLLTAVDDQGNPLPLTKPTLESETLESFADTRGGRMLVENVDVIFKTGKSWLTAGSTKVLGFLGLVLGMIMVPVYLFFFLKDSAAIRTHWHDYVPLKASRFKTSLVETAT